MTFSLVGLRNRLQLKYFCHPTGGVPSAQSVELLNMQSQAQAERFSFNFRFAGGSMWRKVVPKPSQNQVSGQQCFDGFLLQLLKIAKPPRQHQHNTTHSIACKLFGLPNGGNGAAHGRRCAVVWSSNEETGEKRGKTKKIGGEPAWQENTNFVWMRKKFKRFRCRSQAVGKGIFRFREPRKVVGVSARGFAHRLAEWLLLFSLLFTFHFAI